MARRPTSPDLKNLKIGQSTTKKSRHDSKRGNPASTRAKGLVQTCTYTIIQTLLFQPKKRSHPSPQPIRKSKKRTYIVDSGASLHMMEEKLSLSSGKEKPVRQTKNHLEVQAANGIVRPTKDREGLHPGAGHLLYVKPVEDSPSILSLGRLCNELTYSFS